MFTTKKEQESLYENYIIQTISVYNKELLCGLKSILQ